MLKSTHFSELSNLTANPLASNNQKRVQPHARWQCRLSPADVCAQLGQLAHSNANATTQIRFPIGFSAWLNRYGGCRPW